MSRPPIRSIVACTLLSTACASAPRTEAPEPSVVGEWRAPTDGSVLTLSSGGLYSLSITDQARPVMGSFTFDARAGTLSMTTRRESPACGDDSATYSVRVGDLRMDLEAVRDGCDLRRKILSIPLERIRTP
jgi:hypothetical protein